MSADNFILTARGVQVACGGKLPRLDILACNGGVMCVPSWGMLGIGLEGLDLNGQVRVLADHDASLDGIVGHDMAEKRDGKLLVSGAISSTTDTARCVIDLAKNGFEFQTSVPNKVLHHLWTCLFMVGTPQVHESENFDIDVRKTGRRVAPFVSPIREGKVMRREGFKTFNVKPGYLKPKRTITPAECQKRLPGENIFSPQSLQEREEIILARDLGELDNDCINREEVMLRDALVNGKIEIWEDVDGTLRKVREVDLLRNAAHAVTLEAGTWWDAETADVLGTLKTWCGLCRKNGGLSPNTLILAPNVVDTFIKDTTILSCLDNRRVQMGLINPKEIAKGVDYIAYLNAPGVYVEIYCDSRTYTDENGVEKQMMPDNTILLGSTSVQVEMHYGPVQDLDAPAELGLSSGVIPARRFPKTWTEKDPSVRHVLLQSAPLPVPVNVDAFLKAIVLDPS